MPPDVRVGHVTHRVEREIFLRSLFDAAPPPAAARHLAEVMRDVAFAAETVLYRAGTVSNEFFFLIDGRVELRREGEAPWTFEAGSVVGIIDALTNRARTRTAVAVSAGHALALRTEDYLELLEDDFDFWQRVIRDVVRRTHALALTLDPPGAFPPATPPDPAVDPARPLGVAGRLAVLRAVDVLRGASTQALVRLVHDIDERALADGEVLFEAGAGTDVYWFVAAGGVDLAGVGPASAAQAAVRARFGPGSLVGSHVALSDGEAAYESRAAMPSRVLRLGKEDFLDAAEDHHGLARSLTAWNALERERLLVLQARMRAGVRSGAG
jgi:CRP-like cAMP-binding protein